MSEPRARKRLGQHFLHDPAVIARIVATIGPAPDWNGDQRRGDNLYSCSLVALDATSGKLRWHFQFTSYNFV